MATMALSSTVTARVTMHKSPFSNPWYGLDCVLYLSLLSYEPPSYLTGDYG